MDQRQESRRRPPAVGASTITQQVTKNFLLTNEVSYKRKIREMILALRIEKAFTKDRILELYLNQIYLGSGNYGVATAALNYFDKSLDELTIGEAAYLGALPKAPNNYNIVRDHQRARSPQLGGRPHARGRPHHGRGSRRRQGRAAGAAPAGRDRACRRRLFRRGGAARDRAALRRGRAVQEGPRGPRHHRSPAAGARRPRAAPASGRLRQDPGLSRPAAARRRCNGLAEDAGRPAADAVALQLAAGDRDRDDQGDGHHRLQGRHHRRDQGRRPGLGTSALAGRPPRSRAQRDHRCAEGRRHHRGRAAGRGRQRHSRPLCAAPGAGDQRRDGGDGSAHRPRPRR
ncbi:MAG: hypothetical protein HC861_05590 [Rhodospirillaceae bacterium]|nr:hypothetical protein [Rhodospirillaceae bacterium]